MTDAPPPRRSTVSPRHRRGGGATTATLPDRSAVDLTGRTAMLHRAPFDCAANGIAA